MTVQVAAAVVDLHTLPGLGWAPSARDIGPTSRALIDLNKGDWHAQH